MPQLRVEVHLGVRTAARAQQRGAVGLRTGGFDSVETRVVTEWDLGYGEALADRCQPVAIHHFLTHAVAPGTPHKIKEA